MIAKPIPKAAIMLPRLAVSGWLNIFSPKIKSTDARI